MTRKAPPRVVVVNDDPTQLHLLTTLLSREGLEVCPATSATEALARMEREGPPALVVTDLHMPEIDGWRFCRLLRSPEYPAYRHIPILVVSATFAGDHAREITRDLGADAFLPLPCSAAELRATVQSLLAGEAPIIRPKVLIVEDSPTLAGLLERTFREHGYETRIALSATEARQAVAEFSPELVVLDYHLPDVPGDRLLAEFKAGGGFPAVLMITSDTDPGLAMHFLTLGADGYLRKPFDPRYLVELSHKVRRERALLRVEDILEARTIQLRESQARLRESEEKYRLLVENIPGVVFTGYADGSVEFYDDKISGLTGWSREEFGDRRHTWLSLIVPEDLPLVRRAFLQALRGDHRYVREYRIRTREGKVRWLQERSRIFRDSRGRIAKVQGVIFEITERKRQEEERLRLDKLESIGILAGGIAHDFNNLLTAILGNINLVSLTALLPPEARDCLAAAEHACLKAQGLAQQLLTFAKGGAPVKQLTALGPLIIEAVTVALAGSPCRAEVSLPEDLWPAEVDPDQLRQALTNILLNAQQAMGTGGVITITGANLTGEIPPELPLPPGAYVRLDITDQGPGIPPELLERIFDPYFTTKPKGSGLGLATAFSILRKHGGYLTATSPPGAGATFTLYLPAATAVREGKASATASPGEVAATGKRILVMDDDPQIGAIACRILEHLGYEATWIPDGAAAVAAYLEAREAGTPFAAVILELTVPGGMGGREALEHLRAADPQVAAIVTSGYAEDPILTSWDRYGFRGVLKKPYRVQEMGELLKRVLSGAHPPPEPGPSPDDRPAPAAVGP